MKNKLIIIVTVLSLIGISTSAQSINHTNKNRIDDLFKKFDNQYSPGAAVVIVKDGEIFYKNGYGIGVTSHKGHKVNLHSGHDAAYRAADLYFPEHNLGIAILSNFYSINPMEYGFKIADMFLEDKSVPNENETSNKQADDETDTDKSLSVQTKNLIV